ncbi:uncharacterized protein LOC133729995 isoform X2 [Rosa rugosa]|uniref:uncharacterized protein LOC133729995 isoform X2 n=1 Tax=Rosa rugosa TaxID=74645 RepID=UPI002B40D050|nr:uncharacterized protein LOC133729995 isoform X2 [Rosa rugosa]
MIMHEDSRLIRFSDGIVSLLESEIDINLRNYQKQSKALSQTLNQFSAVPRIAQLKSEKLIEELHLPNLIVAAKEEEGGYHLIKGILTLEHAKLKVRVELLQRNQCHFMGKDLQSLSMKDLQNLEQQLDSALKHMRSRKNQLMYESIQCFRRRIRRCKSKIILYLLIQFMIFLSDSKWILI